MFHPLKTAGIAGLLLAASLAHAAAQDHPWLDPKLLEAAKAEGGEMTIYSYTNEGEGLPLFKLFEAATGIKVNYVRGADSAADGAHGAGISRQPEILGHRADRDHQQDAAAAFAAVRSAGGEEHFARGARSRTGAGTASTPTTMRPPTTPSTSRRPTCRRPTPISPSTRNGPATSPSTAPTTNGSRRWFEYYGEDKATKLVKDIVAALKPVITDGHLAQARSVGSGEYWLSLNNYVNLTMNVKLAGGPIDYFALDPVALFFGQVGVSAKAPHPNTALLAANFMLSQECETFLAKFGRIPTRADVESNPPGIVAAINKKKVITVLLTPEEEHKWQKLFDQLFKGR